MAFLNLPYSLRISLGAMACGPPFFRVTLNVTSFFHTVEKVFPRCGKTAGGQSATSAAHAETSEELGVEFVESGLEGVLLAFDFPFGAA